MVHPRSAHYLVVCQNEVRQLQAQVLETLVETGVIIHKASQCSHPAFQLNGGVEDVDIRRRLPFKIRKRARHNFYQITTGKASVSQATPYGSSLVTHMLRLWKNPHGRSGRTNRMYHSEPFFMNCDCQGIGVPGYTTGATELDLSFWSKKMGSILSAKQCTCSDSEESSRLELDTARIQHSSSLTAAQLRRCALAGQKQKGSLQIEKYCFSSHRSDLVCSFNFLISFVHGDGNQC